VAFQLYWYFTRVFGRKARDAIKFDNTTKEKNRGGYKVLLFRYIVFGKRFRIRTPHHLPFYALSTHEKDPFH